ncbi:MAG: macro domain-containing protein [Nitrospirales bacterium]
MIHEVEGDILLTDAGCIAHGVAPGDHFLQGLALSLREEWPAMVKDFRHYCQVNNPKPGEVVMWGGPGGKHLVHLLTQEAAAVQGGRPGRATTIYINHALRELKLFIEKEGVKSLALPRLATGVGGLKWEEVRPLIIKHLNVLTIPIHVYTVFHKGVKAKEKS